MPIDEITRMGQQRKHVVEDLIEQAKAKKWTVVQLAKRLQREANTPTMRDQRNWKTLAQTELVDSIARANLDRIIDAYGPKQRIVRTTQDACPACLHAFGHPSNPRVWHAGMVPEHLKGAAHPGCRCGPWRAVGVMIMKKSKQDEHYRNNGLALVDEAMMKLPQNPHDAANQKMKLIHYQQHFSTCKDENCEKCKQLHEKMRNWGGVEKAFKRQKFIHKMRFVINHMLRPKRVRGL